MVSVTKINVFPFFLFFEYIVIDTTNIPEETKLAKFLCELQPIILQVGEGTCWSLSWITVCFLLYWNNEYYWMNSCHVCWRLITLDAAKSKSELYQDWHYISCHGQSYRRYENSCVMSPVALEAVAGRQSPWLKLEPTVFSQFLHRHEQNNPFGTDEQKWFTHNHNVRCF